jgi:hypothetical protein
MHTTAGMCKTVQGIDTQQQTFVREGRINRLPFQKGNETRNKKHEK